MSLVSVVIPTRNRSALCAEAVSSALSQHEVEVEVIVVDDGSTDDTRDVITSMGADAPVTYVYQENRERAAARNRGVRSAGGDYVAFLDSDDLWTAGHLSTAVGALERHPSAVLAFGRARYADEAGRPLWPAPVPPLPMGVSYPRQTVSALSKGGIGFPAASVLIRKETALAHPFDETFDLSRSEDWELWMRIGARYPVIFTGADTTLLRLHPTNTSAEAGAVETSMAIALDLVSNDPAVAPLVAPLRRQLEAAMLLENARLLAISGRRAEAKEKLDKATAIGGGLVSGRSVRRIRVELALPPSLAVLLRRARRILAGRSSTSTNPKWRPRQGVGRRERADRGGLGEPGR